MKTSTLQNFLLCASLALMLNIQLNAQDEIRVHYLGHASFVLDFNDGITALTDFGTSNCWGYNSPIHGIDDFVPLIMTYSHYHDDHYNPDRIPDGVQYTIDSTDNLSIMELNISPVRTCETTPGVESNSSFTFDYAGFRICHLGDAQAEIMNIADPDQQALILEKFPDRIDVLMMTIEGVYPFIPEAEMFIDLLHPGMVIPMHYWSPGYKEEFLSYLELQNDTAGKTYEVNRLEGPLLELMSNDTIHDHIKVIGLTPYPYGETGITERETLIHGLKVYPNPSSGRINVMFSTSVEHDLIVSILNAQGKKAASSKHIHCSKGHHSLEWKLEEFPSGLYFITLYASGYSSSTKLIINH